MSASKYAEKLLILCDQATGIQCRLYQLVDYKRPALFAKDTEIEKFAKLFVKKFPDFPDTLNKEKGNDLFKKRAPEVTTALNDFYCTFLEILNFTDEAWKILTEFATSVQEFKPDLNIDLLSYYMNLLTRYVQIHLLMNLIDTPQMFIASFARAFHHTSGNSEPSLMRIAKYLATFKPNPLKKIQEDATAVSMCVGNTLMTFLPTIQKYSTVAGFLQAKVFNVLQEDPQNLSMPNNEKAQLDLMHLHNMRNWALWGFLICPAELARPGALDMLALCLRETFQLQIFRDKCISIHKEFDDIVDYKSPSGGFKLSKHKKLLKDAYSDDEGTRKYHADLRTYLRSELDIFDNFFREVPSCIPTKFHMLMSLLACARNEIVWFFRHQHFIPFKCSSSKVKGLPYDPQLPAMIDLVLRLTSLIEANKPAVQAYYLQCLTQFDAPKATEVCTAFLAAHSNQHLSQLVHAIIDHLPGRTTGDSLESIRLNWYRISSVVTHQASNIPVHSSTAFSAILNRVVNHTRNIDGIDTQLKTYASFRELFFYRTDLIESLKDTLKTSDGASGCAIAYVKLLHSALHNVHRLCPDEQAQIGKEVVTTGDAYIRLIVQTLERAIQGVIEQTGVLRSKTNYNAVLHRLASQGAHQAAQQSLPGDESQYERRGAVQALAVHHKRISDLCAAIGRNESLILYNIEFVIREYVRDMIGLNLRGAIVNLAVQGPSIAKPSMILNRLKDHIYSFASIERALAIDVHDIARDVLLSEFALPLDDLAAIQNADANPEQGFPIIMHIAGWYANIFSQDLSSLGIVYSSLKRAFISRRNSHGVPISSNSQIGAIEFERFTDVNELRALATLVGPAGIAIIDNRLLKLVSRHMKVVKEVLTVNQSVLINLAGRFTEQSVWLENIPTLRDMDQMCQAITSIGCILHFREMLRDALRTVTQERSQFIFQAAHLAHRAIHDGVVVDPKLSSVDQFAVDVGLDVGEADHALRLALAPYKTTVADNGMFQYLPELFGLMYLSARWRSADFSIEFEGHLNNNHCQALAIRHLLSQFNRTLVRDGTSAAEIERRIAVDLERFVKCSAFTILHMKVLNAKERDPSAHYPLQAIIIFLEQCILAFDGRIEMNVLEQCFPFTILRTTFIQIYEKQTNIHAFAPVADESAD